MIDRNYKKELKEFLNSELNSCYKIFEYNKQFEKYTREGVHKEADKVLIKSLEKTKELKLIEEKIVRILKLNKIKIEDFKKEFNIIISEILEVLKKISELNEKVKVIINEKRGSVLEELRKLDVSKSIYVKNNFDMNEGFIDIVE